MLSFGYIASAINSWGEEREKFNSSFRTSDVENYGYWRFIEFVRKSETGSKEGYVEEKIKLRQDKTRILETHTHTHTQVPSEKKLKKKELRNFENILHIYNCAACCCCLIAKLFEYSNLYINK